MRIQISSNNLFKNKGTLKLFTYIHIYIYIYMPHPDYIS